MALDSTKFESCLKLATEAKELRDKAQELLKQAQPIEEKAVGSFREAREKMLKALQEEKEKLEEEIETIKTEYFELASTFCEQNGGHTYICRTVTTSNRPLYHSPTEGFVYPTKTYRTCLVCGYTDDPWRFRMPHNMFYQKGSEEVIQKAAEQSEKLELKKTAQRILEIREQFKNLTEKLNENSRDFEEICSLFGHDAEATGNEVYKCKCCGKEMGYREYINAHYAAKYKGGIVPFYYQDNGFIL